MKDNLLRLRVNVLLDERNAEIERLQSEKNALYITLQNIKLELESYPHCPLCGNVHGEGHEEGCIGYEIDEAIKKARGEE